ncbi:uncharacterized protein B0I36DRAFT_356193 [Microdochium trichocladiopsis]|uniref:Uncharacterized protein n=1 Tax=Microdochium trichocladiopsis TaxID=1682393 RepID=A0A9P8XSE0_9PEZI|nr:uncharacterized protein B0I36DRAFT_356193 [Microdochium trichocladiopsis]KAH7012095.1 hypothetical protein B0I36DRAFT_356193 [Microdochium trichocladiopsis]
MTCSPCSIPPLWAGDRLPLFLPALLSISLSMFALRTMQRNPQQQSQSWTQSSGTRPATQCGSQTTTSRASNESVPEEVRGAPCGGHTDSRWPLLTFHASASHKAVPETHASPPELYRRHRDRFRHFPSSPAMERLMGTQFWRVLVLADQANRFARPLACLMQTVAAARSSALGSWLSFRSFYVDDFARDQSLATLEALGKFHQDTIVSQSSLAMIYNGQALMCLHNLGILCREHGLRFGDEDELDKARTIWKSNVRCHGTRLLDRVHQVLGVIWADNDHVVQRAVATRSILLLWGDGEVGSDSQERHYAEKPHAVGRCAERLDAIGTLHDTDGVVLVNEDGRRCVTVVGQQTQPFLHDAQVVQLDGLGTMRVRRCPSR